MKKLFFVATLLVAGVMSAKTGVVKPVEKQNVTKDIKGIKKAMATFPVRISCGNTYMVTFPDSWSLEKISIWVMGFDAGDCR
ncbi:hypothetical protein JZ968_08130 [Riemerella anatipestifer]